MLMVTTGAVSPELYVPAGGVKTGGATTDPGTVTVIGVLVVLPLAFVEFSVKVWVAVGWIVTLPLPAVTGPIMSM